MSACEREGSNRMVSAQAAVSAPETSELPTSGGAKKCVAWTPERRAQAAQAIHTWKPWLKTRGPVTPEGKRVSSMNRYQGGIREKQRAARREARAAFAAFDAAVLELRQWRWFCARADAGLAVTEEDLAKAVLPEVDVFARLDDEEPETQPNEEQQ